MKCLQTTPKKHQIVNLLTHNQTKYYMMMINHLNHLIQCMTLTQEEEEDEEEGEEEGKVEATIKLSQFFKRREKNDFLLL
jgi:hypothetical protein